jgi:hypothetical protein
MLDIEVFTFLPVSQKRKLAVFRPNQNYFHLPRLSLPIASQQLATASALPPLPGRPFPFLGNERFFRPGLKSE